MEAAEVVGHPEPTSTASGATFYSCPDRAAAFLRDQFFLESSSNRGPEPLTSPTNLNPNVCARLYESARASTSVWSVVSPKLPRIALPPLKRWPPVCNRASALILPGKHRMIPS